MRQFNYAVALLTAVTVAGCGGGGSTGGSQATKIQFSSEVTFGDSLSDVGTYAVGTVATLHGGKFTVNSLTPSPQNWTELMAISLGLPVPCAAQTGLDGSAAQGLSVPVVNHAGCTAYAQGGARVTQAAGIDNAMLDPALGGSATLGLLTVPVKMQIQNHLAAVGGKFSGTEIVFVLAGANDVLVQLATLKANATAAGTAAATTAVTNAVPAQVASDVSNHVCMPTDAQASNCVAQAIAELTPTVGASAGAAAAATYVTNVGAPAAVQAVGQAGAELAGYVNALIIGNGAKYVTVVNIPDIGSSPFGQALDASTLSLTNTMVSTFNAQLSTALTGNANAVLVDANSQSHLNVSFR